MHAPTSPDDLRGRRLRLAEMHAVRQKREERFFLEGSLIEFFKAAWATMDPAPYQHGWHLDAIAEHLEAVSYGQIRKLCVNVPPRHSKPVAHDALVLTKAKGLIRLDQIIVGDDVLTHLGNWKPVLAVHRQGVLPVVRITTDAGREVDAAPDHPFLTPNGWIEAGKLQPDDVVGVVPPQTRCGANTILREEARLLGYMVGDGHCGISTPNITCADDDVAADIVRCMTALGFQANEQRYKMASTGYMLRRISMRGQHLEARRTVKGYIGPVKRWLLTHNLVKVSSYTKLVPQAVMEGSDDIVADFLGAYWSCDGYIQQKGRKKGGGERSDLALGCDSVNKALLQQVQTLLARLGIDARLRMKRVKLKTKKQGDFYTSYALALRSQDDCYRFAQKITMYHSKRKRMDYQYRRRFDFDRPIWGDVVQAVEPAGEKECLCLTVADDKSFTANGIAVHNTLLCSVAWNAWAWCKPADERYPLIGPSAKLMCLSYADPLAMDNATLARRLIESEWYQSRWGERVEITADQDAKNKFDTTAGGTRISGSFRGSVTGRGAGLRVYDDPHKMDEVESDPIREGVLRLYDTTLRSRITDPRHSAEVLVAQRGHEKDLSNTFLEEGDVVHLNLPAEYDPSRHCVTVLKWDAKGEAEQSWEDPRTTDGELLWPQRFGTKELATFKRKSHEWSAQWQQAPVPRGGGILKRDWWGTYELAIGASPRHEFDLVIASLDPAFTAKQENDPSGFTVWGVYHEKGDAKVLLLHAWKKWLELHGQTMERLPNEENASYVRRASPQWGLVEWVAHDCKRLRVRQLLIENKASGHSVAQEIQRLYGDKDWQTQLVNPGDLDKRARAFAISHLFSAGMIEAPASVSGDLLVFRDWAQMVVDECAKFRGLPGEEDNLVDSVTQCLKFLRDSGFAVRNDERLVADMLMSKYKSPSKALYPV